MKSLPSIDLSRIRDHAGAKDRGFEELAYLLAWDLEGLERGTEIERRATPDGGIEFSCIPAGKGNGGRWAWQAKYLFAFTSSTFAQMTKSVDAALQSTPDLERYIFVLPKDRSSAALTKWNVAVAKWSKKAKANGMTVDFKFCGESQILAAATSDKHAGAIRYFFDESFLTKQFMAKQIDREVKNLGARYSPDVNVETEARSIIDAACRGPRFVETLTQLLKAPCDNRVVPDPKWAPDHVILNEAKTIEGLLNTWGNIVASSLELVADPGEDVFRSIERQAKELRRAIDAARSNVETRIAELSGQIRSLGENGQAAAKSQTKRRKMVTKKVENEGEQMCRNLRSFDMFLWRLGEAVDEVLHYLGSPDVAAAISGSVLLVGEAGCGKSHLVADSATEQINADLPAVLLLGQHMEKGLIDTQIVQMMGLGPLTLSDMLQALDVAARVRRSGRALLAIDAVNEGAGADLWESQLPGLVAEVTSYPWVALVITVRDVYESSVLPGGLPVGMTRSVHRGLVGHEEEALRLYAETYNLRLPDLPLSVPQISNPLFLRSLCQSVRGRGLTEIPRQSGSLVWVFDGLIEAVERTLRRHDRFDFADWERKVHRAVEALAAAMVDCGSEALPIAHASSLCQGIHSNVSNSKS